MGLRQPGRAAAMAAGDFQRVLAMRPVSRSPHFALHFADRPVSAPPTSPVTRAAQPSASQGFLPGDKRLRADLSTGTNTHGQTLVDELAKTAADTPQDGASTPFGLSLAAARVSESPPTQTMPSLPVARAALPARTAPMGPRLGLVVPKRCARRSVTRNLIRRLARAAFARHCKDLPAGDWVLRLRETIDPRQFISASSMPLRRALSTEMTQLFTSAVQTAGAGRPMAVRRAAKAGGAKGRP